MHAHINKGMAHNIDSIAFICTQTLHMHLYTPAFNL